MFRRNDNLLPRGLLALAALIIAACSSGPDLRESQPPAASAPVLPPPAEVARGTFVVAAGTLDTWNAIGQVLVRLDGVTYETRAQMLGLYAVRYRGERFLILTKGLVITDERQSLATEVGARHLDGKPNGSEAAVELLGKLKHRLPDELARIGAATHRR